jgi:hypothetical protein
MVKLYFEDHGGHKNWRTSWCVTCSSTGEPTVVRIDRRRSPARWRQGAWHASVPCPSAGAPHQCPPDAHAVRAGHADPRCLALGLSVHYAIADARRPGRVVVHGSLSVHHPRGWDEIADPSRREQGSRWRIRCHRRLLSSYGSGRLRSSDGGILHIPFAWVQKREVTK